MSVISNGAKSVSRHQYLCPDAIPILITASGPVLDASSSNINPGTGTGGGNDDDY